MRILNCWNKDLDKWLYFKKKKKKQHDPDKLFCCSLKILSRFPRLSKFVSLQPEKHRDFFSIIITIISWQRELTMSCECLVTDSYFFLTLFFSGQVLFPQRGKEEELISASQWELLNLDVDTILQMPSDVQALASLEHHEFMEIMSKYLYESIGTQEFVRRHMLTQSPCIVVPSTLHISLTKAATILGLGRESLVSVAVDENSRMDPIGWYSFCPLSLFSPNFFFF